MRMNNRTTGNEFERSFAQMLSTRRFWVHLLAQNSAGQPADVIAVKNGVAHLIDCKLCTGNSFAVSRVEENQRYAMHLWSECGNGLGWFAILINGMVYMVTLSQLEESDKKRLSEDWLSDHGISFENWVVSQCASP